MSSLIKRIDSMSYTQIEMLKKFEAKLSYESEGLLLELGVENAGAIRSAILRSGVGKVSKGERLLWPYYEAAGHDDGSNSASVN
jgi:hypothetical protein